jgi:hypothetical protein
LVLDKELKSDQINPKGRGLSAHCAARADFSPASGRTLKAALIMVGLTFGG